MCTSHWHKISNFQKTATNVLPCWFCFLLRLPPGHAFCYWLLLHCTFKSGFDPCIVLLWTLPLLGTSVQCLNWICFAYFIEMYFIIIAAWFHVSQSHPPLSLATLDTDHNNKLTPTFVLSSAWIKVAGLCKLIVHSRHCIVSASIISGVRGWCHNHHDICGWRREPGPGAGIMLGNWFVWAHSALNIWCVTLSHAAPVTPTPPPWHPSQPCHVETDLFVRMSCGH